MYHIKPFVTQVHHTGNLNIDKADAKATRIHSSRMRTGCCSGHGGWGLGGVSQQALGRGVSARGVSATPPEQNDRRLWKHKLAATTLRTVKMTSWQFQLYIVWKFANFKEKVRFRTVQMAHVITWQIMSYNRDKSWGFVSFRESSALFPGRFAFSPSIINRLRSIVFVSFRYCKYVCKYTVLGTLSSCCWPRIIALNTCSRRKQPLLHWVNLQIEIQQVSRLAYASCSMSFIILWPFLSFIIAWKGL